MEQQTAHSEKPKRRVSFFKKYSQIEEHAKAVLLSEELAPLVARFPIKKIPIGISGIEEEEEKSRATTDAKKKRRREQVKAEGNAEARKAG